MVPQSIGKENIYPKTTPVYLNRYFTLVKTMFLFETDGSFITSQVSHLQNKLVLETKPLCHLRFGADSWS